jgi:beta-lactamase class A
MPTGHRAAVAAVLAAVVAAGPSATALRAQPSLPDQIAAKFQRTLDTLAAAAPGVVGVGVVDLTSGRRYDVNGAVVFPQGSAIKIPLLLELFRRADAKELALTDRITLTAKDRTGGSSIMQYFSGGGSALSLHDLTIPMLLLSDNTATNMLIDAVGMEKVNATMATMGLPNTRLRRKMIRQEEQVKGNENVSTPREAVDLMARLASCQVPLTAASCAEVVRLLELPKGGAFREPIPANVPVAWKPGGLDGVSTAWGLVKLPGAPYAVSIMVTYGTANPDAVVRDISRAVYTHFTQVAGSTDLGARVAPSLIKPKGQ